MPVRYRVISPDQDTFFEVSHVLSRTAVSVLATSGKGLWHLVNGKINDKNRAKFEEMGVTIDVIS